LEQVAFMAQLRSRFVARLKADQRGAVLVEFAMVGPILIVMILGIVAYGGYFWMSHAVQQVANDAARAAVAGLVATERASLAQSALSSSIGGYPFLVPSAAKATVSGDSTELKVAVAYDASGSPFWAFKGLIPLPSTTITRQAAIRLGGY
jgi:Flp pilus assembly protein TadG